MAIPEDDYSPFTVEYAIRIDEMEAGGTSVRISVLEVLLSDSPGYSILEPYLDGALAEMRDSYNANESNGILYVDKNVTGGRAYGLIE